MSEIFTTAQLREKLNAIYHGHRSVSESEMAAKAELEITVSYAALRAELAAILRRFRWCKANNRTQDMDAELYDLLNEACERTVSDE